MSSFRVRSGRFVNLTGIDPIARQTSPFRAGKDRCARHGCVLGVRGSVGIDRSRHGGLGSSGGGKSPDLLVEGITQDGKKPRRRESRGEKSFVPESRKTWTIGDSGSTIQDSETPESS